MEGVKAELRYSESFSHSARETVLQTFIDEGIHTETADTDISYKSVSVAPENLIIDFIVTYAVLQFLQGFVSAAGADTWEATKRALKRVRASHNWGQEASIVDEEKKTHANYIVPSDPSESNAAIDAIAADFAALKKVDERWWLGPPDSRWGTGMESAQRKKTPDNQS
jgi:hypothetical protein